MKNLINFIKLTHKFQQVKRALYVNGENRKENDQEHSYQLAMVAFYLINSKNFKLNSDLAIKYALVHDLVEIYAGDTPAYTKNKKLIDSKKKREYIAEKKLKENFPEFKDLPKLIRGYKELKDKESKFVYALDKIVPTINIYLDKGRTWKNNKVTFEEIIEYKKDKVKKSPEIESYYKKLIKIIEKDKSRLFDF